MSLLLVFLEFSSWKEIQEDVLGVEEGLLYTDTQLIEMYRHEKNMAWEHPHVQIFRFFQAYEFIFRLQIEVGGGECFITFMLVAAVVVVGAMTQSWLVNSV